MLTCFRVGFRLTAINPRFRLSSVRYLHYTTRLRESVSAGDIKEGDLLQIDGGLWRVMSKSFSRTAQGRAYIQTELRRKFLSVRMWGLRGVAAFFRTC